MFLLQVSHLAKGLDIAVHSNSFSSQAVSSSSMTAGATVAIAVGELLNNDVYSVWISS